MCTAQKFSGWLGNIGSPKETSQALHKISYQSGNITLDWCPMSDLGVMLITQTWVSRREEISQSVARLAIAPLVTKLRLDNAN